MKIPLPAFLKNSITSSHIDMVKVMGGTFTRNILRGLVKILVVGYLAPAVYGILKSIFDFFRILSSLADFGLDYAMVTFVSAARRKGEQSEQNQMLKIVLFLKLYIVLAAVLIGNLLAPKLAVWVLSDASLTIYIRCVFFALGGQLLWTYISSYFSAHQDFTKLALYLSTMPFLMLIATGCMIFFNKFNLHTIIMLYLFAPFVTALLWWFVLNKYFMKYSSWNTLLVKKLFNFSRWVYLSNSASTTRNHLNTLLLKNASLSGSVTAGNLNAGLYGFGSELASEITIFSESILTVLLPKATSKTSAEELKRFLKRAYRNLVLLIVPLFCLMFLAKPFLIYFLAYFKESYLEYVPALPIFYILYSGALFSIASLPMRTALYAMRLPQIETVMELIMLVILVAGGILLIPIYGSIGAAAVVFIQRFLSFITITIYGIKKLNSMENLN